MIEVSMRVLPELDKKFATYCPILSHLNDTHLLHKVHHTLTQLLFYKEEVDSETFALRSLGRRAISEIMIANKA